MGCCASNTGLTTLNSNITTLNGQFGSVSSGSINSVNKSGVYYLTNAVTDKPTSSGGMFIVAMYPSGIGVGFYVTFSSTQAIYRGTYENSRWTFYALT